MFMVAFTSGRQTIALTFIQVDHSEPRATTRRTFEVLLLILIVDLMCSIIN